jgi:UDP-glucose 4-epimerase
MEKINLFKNKVLLITGGTGSFGSAVLSRFFDSGLKSIRIFSRDEKKQHDLRMKINDKKVQFYIGDVRDYKSISHAMIGVNYVFHAAALKQVPSCEFFPIEAVKTNILGTENVIDAAIKHKVEKLICLSTDKAVYPINAMGLTKALMEKVMIAKSRELENSNTILCGTRYGNVMASRGSVIPLFIEQIKSGKNITITDPSMTRFLMSLEDAVNLVLYAFQNGKQGEIFIQKSPASTIKDLAEAIIKLYDASNTKIDIIGARHGEKLYETLINREEMTGAVDLGNYFKLLPDSRDLNYNKYFFEGQKFTDNLKEYHSHNTKRLKVEDIIEILLRITEIKEDLINGE